MADRTHVLFVGGTGRSGSTVLANVLGEVPGCVSVGEVRFLWERGILEDRLCGCGLAFSACPFWSEVLQRTLGTRGAAGLADLAGRVHAELHHASQLRRLPRAAATGASGLSAGSELTSLLPRLYRAIADVSGASYVVDSSKLPTYGHLLASLPAVDVSVVHLVRDPRAAAFSWLRQKEQPDRGRPGLMERRGVTKSAGLWVAWNSGLERLARTRSVPYQRLRYEDFVADPAGETATLLGQLGLDPDVAGLFPEPHTVRLTPSHTVAGNPARLKHGLVPMRLDDEWRTAMAPRERRLVTALTAPLLHRYGYARR